MRVAKAKGRLRGKQPKLNPRREARLVALLKSGEYSTGEIGNLFGRRAVDRVQRNRTRRRQARSPTIRHRPDPLNWRNPRRCPGNKPGDSDIPMAGRGPAGSPRMRDIACIGRGCLLISAAGSPHGTEQVVNHMIT